MTEKSQSELIEEVLARFVEPVTGSLLGSGYPYLDVSKPNIHDTKAEFFG